MAWSKAPGGCRRLSPLLRGRAAREGHASSPACASHCCMTHCTCQGLLGNTRAAQTRTEGCTLHGYTSYRPAQESMQIMCREQGGGGASLLGEDLGPCLILGSLIINPGLLRLHIIQGILSHQMECRPQLQYQSRTHSRQPTEAAPCPLRAIGLQSTAYMSAAHLSVELLCQVIVASLVGPVRLLDLVYLSFLELKCLGATFLSHHGHNIKYLWKFVRHPVIEQAQACLKAYHYQSVRARAHTAYYRSLPSIPQAHCQLHASFHAGASSWYAYMRQAGPLFKVKGG